ncbi:MAG: hypothetical protein Q8891_17490 [Bacteroidota bacterium]|jgi:hypothetical protein|nr:hypothetical protein [Bacteroidota bacterium]
MHNNPCSGVWKLVEALVDYKDSLVGFYDTGEQGVYLMDDQ